MVNSLISVVIMIILSLFTVQSVLFIYMLLSKLLQNSYRQKMDGFKEELREKVFRYLYRKDNTILEQAWSRMELKALEELFSDFADVVQGDEVEERITIFSETHFSELYKRNLLHRRWSIRMNSLYALEDFQMRGMVPFLLGPYQSRKLSLEERRQLLKILVRFQTSQWEDLLKDPEWRLSEFMYRSLFGVMTESQFHTMVSCLKEYPEYIQLPVVDMIGIDGKREYLGYLEEKLNSASGEMKIRMLKAMNELGYSGILKQMDQVYSPESTWEERLMLSKLLGRTNLSESFSLLMEFLSDTNFDVRNNAAKSILAIDGGTELLRHVYETSTDPYARDMAEEWLYKGGEVREQ